MGSFIYYCEHCSAKLNVDDAWKGRTLDCPACGKKLSFAAADADMPLPPGAEMQSAPEPENADNMPLPPPGVGKPAEAAAPKKANDKSIPRKIRMKPLSAAVAEKSESSISESGLNDITSAANAEKSADPQAGPHTAYVGPATVTSGKFNLRTNSMKVDAQQSQPPVQKSVPAANNGKSSYFWGRLGVSAMVVMAVLSLIYAVFLSCIVSQVYALLVELIPEKQQLAEVNKQLNKREKSLSAHFKNAVLLLQGTGNINSDGTLNGLKLSEEICRRPDPMPLGVLSPQEMAEVRRILDQYKNSTNKIKEEFVRSFGAVGRLQSNKNNLDSNSILTISPIVVQAGEIKQQLYANEAGKLKELNTLHQALTDIERNLGSELQNNRIKQAELKKAQAAVKFVKKQLFPKDSNLTIVHAVATNNGKAAAKDPKADLLTAINLISALSGDWQLDHEIRAMEQLLEKVPVLQKKFEQKKMLLFLIACVFMTGINLSALIWAFRLMVHSDFLKAHFDSAEILAKILGKMR